MQFNQWSFYISSNLKWTPCIFWWHAKYSKYIRVQRQQLFNSYRFTLSDNTNRRVRVCNGDKCCKPLDVSEYDSWSFKGTNVFLFSMHSLLFPLWLFVLLIFWWLDVGMSSSTKYIWKLSGVWLPKLDFMAAKWSIWLHIKFIFPEF